MEQVPSPAPNGAPKDALYEQVTWVMGVLCTLDYDQAHAFLEDVIIQAFRYGKKIQGERVYKQISCS